MSRSWKFSYPQYLSSKKGIDDRSLNRSVWNKLALALERRGTRELLRVLEAGAGIGTMIERTVDWGLIDQAEYTAVDLMEENIREGRRELSGWAADRRFELAWNSDAEAVLHTNRGMISIFLVAENVHTFLGTPTSRETLDLVIAHAFMDIVDVWTVLLRFFAVLKPQGMLYLSLNYDGETLFLPVIDKELDEQVIRLYHESMDRRIVEGRGTGGSKTGRLLLAELQGCGANLLASGSSDWIVLPADSGYPEDEAYFLHCIVETIYQALRGHREINQQEFEQWIERRHLQIDHAQLIYIAKQMDILAIPPESGRENSQGRCGSVSDNSFG